MRVAYKTADSSYPKQGNRELPVVLDFTNSGIVNDDLSYEQQQSQIETIQSVYIDNNDNASSIILIFLDTLQRIVAQPFSQGIYPVISAGRIRYTAQTAQGQKITVIFSNTEKKYQVWGAVPGVLVVPPLTNPAINFQPLVAGDNTLVPGVLNTTIKIYRLLLAFGAGTNIQFFSGPSANNVPLTGLMNMFAGGSINLQPSGIPWFNTKTGDDFVMNSSNAVNMGGTLGYVQS